MEGVEAEVRPHPSASDLEETAGMLHIRSSSMMAGYLDTEGVDESPLEDGWFATGDLARIDDDGDIRLLGRHSDVINVSGMKVVPSEVEQVIAAVPGVVDVKVYPGRRKSGDQFVQAALVLESGVKAETIRKHCTEHLVYFKRPERMHSIESLPRSPAGKIVVEELP